MSESVRNIVFYRFLNHTPVGQLLLAADETGIRYLHFLSGTEQAKHGLPPNSQSADAAEPWQRDSGQLDDAARQLDAWFAGELRDFQLPLAPQGTKFQRKVWSALREIPWGRTWTYGQLARRIGQPGASRAVGLANGRNPISIIIPCHRVIGRNGRLTGYGGGLPNKETLLRFEKSWPIGGQQQTFEFKESNPAETNAALSGNSDDR